MNKEQNNCPTTNSSKNHPNISFDKQEDTTPTENLNFLRDLIQEKIVLLHEQENQTTNKK